MAISYRFLPSKCKAVIMLLTFNSCFLDKIKKDKIYVDTLQKFTFSFLHVDGTLIPQHKPIA